MYMSLIGMVARKLLDNMMETEKKYLHSIDKHMYLCGLQVRHKQSGFPSNLYVYTWGSVGSLEANEM